MEAFALVGKTLYGCPLAILVKLLRLVPLARGHKWIMHQLIMMLGTYSRGGTKKLEGNYADILEVFEHVNPSNF